MTPSLDDDIYGQPPQDPTDLRALLDEWRKTVAIVPWSEHPTRSNDVALYRLLTVMIDRLERLENEFHHDDLRP